MAVAEDLEFELEALLATYGEDTVHVHQQPSTHRKGSACSHTIEVPVAPRSGADCEQFVAALLVLTLSPGYPTRPPSVQLRDAKGLPDQHLAELQAALQGEARSMAGEMQLGHLVESAIELLSAANQPFGACTICLEPLTGDPSIGTTPGSAASVRAISSCSSRDGGRGALQVVRLPCYHCYHAACFGPWWHWQQQRLAQRERQLWSEYKSMAPLKLEEEGIRQEAVTVGGGTADNAQAEDGAAERAYVLPCPACRAEVAPASLAHIWQQLQAVTAESWSGGGGRAAWSELPPQQRQQLQAMQRRHAAVMRRQQQCGGLVEASHSVSLSDLQQAGTASANAAAAAAAAAATGLAADARAVAEPPLAAPGLTSSGIAGEPGAHQASGARKGGRGGRLPPAGGRGERLRGGRVEGGTACCGGDNGSGSGRGRGRKGGQQRQPSAAAVPGAAAGAAAAAASLKALHIDRPAGQQQRRPSAGRGRGRGRGSSSLASSAGLAPAPSS